MTDDVKKAAELKKTGLNRRQLLGATAGGAALTAGGGTAALLSGGAALTAAGTPTPTPLRQKSRSRPASSTPITASGPRARRGSCAFSASRRCAS